MRNKSCSLCQASASCDGSVVVWNIEEQVRWPKSAVPVCCVFLSYLEFSWPPSRRRWTVGLWCRRPMTSVTPSLCVGWPGSPGRRRWAPSALPAIQPSNSKAWITRGFLLAVFGSARGDKGESVWTRVLGTREHSVRWSDYTGEFPVNLQPPSSPYFQVNVKSCERHQCS